MDYPFLVRVEEKNNKASDFLYSDALTAWKFYAECAGSIVTDTGSFSIVTLFKDGIAISRTQEEGINFNLPPRVIDVYREIKEPNRSVRV